MVRLQSCEVRVRNRIRPRLGNFLCNFTNIKELREKTIAYYRLRNRSISQMQAEAKFAGKNQNELLFDALVF